MELIDKLSKTQSSKEKLSKTQANEDEWSETLSSLPWEWLEMLSNTAETLAMPAFQNLNTQPIAIQYWKLLKLYLQFNSQITQFWCSTFIKK